jgi:hypothetical protein
MLFVGSDGQTKKDLQKLLEIPDSDAEKFASIAKEFAAALHTSASNTVTFEVCDNPI